MFVLFQIYNEKRRQFSLVRNNPQDIVEKVAADIERLLAKKRKALEVNTHTPEYTRAHTCTTDKHTQLNAYTHKYTHT